MYQLSQTNRLCGWIGVLVVKLLVIFLRVGLCTEVVMGLSFIKIPKNNRMDLPRDMRLKKLRVTSLVVFKKEHFVK